MTTATSGVVHTGTGSDEHSIGNRLSTPRNDHVTAAASRDISSSNSNRNNENFFQSPSTDTSLATEGSAFSEPTTTITCQQQSIETDDQRLPVSHEDARSTAASKATTFHLPSSSAATSSIKAKVKDIGRGWWPFSFIDDSGSEVDSSDNDDVSSHNGDLTDHESDDNVKVNEVRPRTPEQQPQLQSTAASAFHPIRARTNVCKSNSRPISDEQHDHVKQPLLTVPRTPFVVPRIVLDQSALQQDPQLSPLLLGSVRHPPSGITGAFSTRKGSKRRR